jgi:hypothetical protein
VYSLPGGVFTKSLPSNERLFWLHYSGFRVSCHNTYIHTYIHPYIHWVNSGEILLCSCVSNLVWRDLVWYDLSDYLSVYLHLLLLWHYKPKKSRPSQFQDFGILYMDIWYDFLRGDLFVAKPLLTQENINTEKNADIHTCPEWNSKPCSQCWSSRWENTP